MPARVARRDTCFSTGGDRFSAGRATPARTLAALLLLLLLWLPAGCQGRDRDPGLLQPSGPGGALQEVAAPVGVQQLAAELEERNPQLTILEPKDGALLPDGPWQLRLNLRDWPLSDAGELGLGPHVVVQLDDDPPRRLTAPMAGPGGDGASDLSLTLPPLSPGSHRLTAFAARPWGEVVKSPGAHQQIRLLRVAETPLRVPEGGSPQLIPVNPGPEPRAEPVLLDWLLLDAPLQGLREGDASWRLRVTVNGDSFLVDQNTPLWLRGWRQGSNILQLDLVDGRGEPLNPPFNSLLSEVVISGAAPRPAWLQGRLDDTSLARLLGRELAAAPGQQPAAGPAPEPEPLLEPERALEPEPAPEPAPESDSEPEPEQEPEQEPDLPPSPEGEATLPPEPGPGPGADAASASDPHDTAQGSRELEEKPDEEPAPATDDPEPPPAPPVPSPSAETSIQPNASLARPAREEVQEDGSLIRPRRGGPLAGLRDRLKP